MLLIPSSLSQLAVYLLNKVDVLYKEGNNNNNKKEAKIVYITVGSSCVAAMLHLFSLGLLTIRWFASDCEMIEDSWGWQLEWRLAILLPNWSRHGERCSNSERHASVLVKFLKQMEYYLIIIKAVGLIKILFIEIKLNAKQN